MLNVAFYFLLCWMFLCRVTWGHWYSNRRRLKRIITVKHSSLFWSGVHDKERNLMTSTSERQRNGGHQEVSGDSKCDYQADQPPPRRRRRDRPSGVVPRGTELWRTDWSHPGAHFYTFPDKLMTKFAKIYDRKNCNFTAVNAIFCRYFLMTRSWCRPNVRLG